MHGSLFSCYNLHMTRKISVPILIALSILLLLASCTSAARFDLGSDITIVMGRASMTTENVSLAKVLASGITSRCGAKVSIVNDQNPQVPNEISFGITNRDYCTQFCKGLRVDDWCIASVGGQVVIAGGDMVSTKAAIDAFLEKIDALEGKLDDFETRHNGDYEVDSFLLGGLPIYEYTIVVPKLGGETFRAATFLKNLIVATTGYQMVVAVNSEGRAINIGVNQADTENGYTAKSNGTDLEFNGPVYMLMAAVREFFEPALSQTSGSISVDLPKSPVSSWGNYENGFVLVDAQNQTVREGITYTRNRYIDADNTPVVAYVLKVEKGHGTLINGTPNNGYELKNVGATTVQAAKSAMAAGYDVIGAVNADFFDMGGTGAPRGTCIKNSVVMQITKTTSRSFFAVLDDGSYYCAAGAPSNSILGHIVEAVGGSAVLLKDGKIPTSLNDKTRHPRTCVGYDDQGNAYLVVVDGRRATISNGAYLGDMALILKDFGATEAINLDGGGSSTFVINEGGKLNVKNSPSDGSLRYDYNSLIVVSEWI